MQAAAPWGRLPAMCRHQAPRAPHSTPRCPRQPWTPPTSVLRRPRKEAGRQAKSRVFPLRRHSWHQHPRRRPQLTPPRRKPMREANSSAESSPVLNVVRRMARRACDLDTAFYECILAICGLKFELDGAKPHQLGLQIVLLLCRFLFLCALQTKSRFISLETLSSIIYGDNQQEVASCLR